MDINTYNQFKENRIKILLATASSTLKIYKFSVIYNNIYTDSVKWGKHVDPTVDWYKQDYGPKKDNYADSFNHVYFTMLSYEKIFGH